MFSKQFFEISLLMDYYTISVAVLVTKFQASDTQFKKTRLKTKSNSDILCHNNKEIFY